MSEITRRTFIQSTLAITATLVGVSPASGASSYKLGKTSKFKAGTLLIVTVPGRSQKISVLSTAKGYFAFSTTCTHAGGQLRVSGTKLVCNSHGAQFDAQTGQPTAGPATKSLKKYSTSVKNGYLYITI